MNCQKCRQPLKLDGLLEDLDPAAFSLLVTSSSPHTKQTMPFPKPAQRCCNRGRTSFKLAQERHCSSQKATSYWNSSERHPFTEKVESLKNAGRLHPSVPLKVEKTKKEEDRDYDAMMDAEAGAVDEDEEGEERL